MVRRSAVVLWLVFASCGGSEALVGEDVVGLDDLGVAEQSARVTRQQAQLAAQLVDATRGYLPFAYTADGCYARALYMSAELASRRVPSSAQYLTGMLSPGNGVTWGWHVAPMVEVDGAPGRTVLDPSLAPQGPISLEEWVRRSSPQGGYELFWTVGSTYYLTGFSSPNAQAAPVIQSFAELSPFQRSDLEHACAVMNQYLAYERAPGEAQKRALLIGRTRSLANRLLAVGKLSGYQTNGALRCGGASVPVCREAPERCAGDADCCSTLCGATGTCQARPIDAAPVTPAPGVTDAGAGADAGVMGADGGAGRIDAGVMGADGGAGRIDAGVTGVDGGAGRVDAGVMGADGGAGRIDAGVTGVDGGAGRVDAGVGGADAGTAASTPALVNGMPVSFTGSAYSTRAFRIEVAPGTSSVRFELRGASGDADLYVRFGAAPTLSTYDARPWLSDSNETVTTASPRPGTWFVMVHGSGAFSTVSLTATAR